MPDTDDHGSAPRGQDRPHWRPAYIALLAGTLVLVLAASASAGLLFWADSRVDRVDVQGISPVGEPEVVEVAGEEPDPDLDLEDVVNVLVVGSDAREGLTEEQRRALGTGDEDGERTDTIMLVRLDPKQDAVSLLSFPRDLLVTRCDGSRGRINAAYQIGEQTGVGGPSCLVQTVAEFSGLPVHHYAAVDFPGFIELVDLVGGVTVYLEHPIDDWRANLDLPGGCNRLDGETALGFVRHRASDSDYGRVARQQRFVKELLREATRLGNILNLPRLLRMIDTAAQAVQTDQDFSLDLMRRIAFTFRDLAGDDNVVARTVPGDFQMIDGIAFEVPLEDQAEQLFAAFQSGAFHAEEDGAPTVAPADVPPVTVLNGAGVSGLASRARAELEAEGFAVAAIGDADEFDRETTEVRHPEDLAEEAEVVAAALHGAELAPGDADELVVVLGGDYDPDRAVVEAPAEPPPPVIDEAFVGAQAPPARCYD